MISWMIPQFTSSWKRLSLGGLITFGDEKRPHNLKQSDAILGWDLSRGKSISTLK